MPVRSIGANGGALGQVSDGAQGAGVTLLRTSDGMKQKNLATTGARSWYSICAEFPYARSRLSPGLGGGSSKVAVAAPTSACEWLNGQWRR